MIIVHILGGIGNQMFQYAFARYLSIKHETKVKLDITSFEEYKLHKYRLFVFNLEENLATTEEINNLKYKKLNLVNNFLYKIKGKKNSKYSKKYIKETFYHFEPEFINLPDNVYLDGYWQSEKYFKPIAEILRKDFTVRKELSGKNKDFAEQIKSGNSVSLHIRRGDYVKDASTKNMYYVDLDKYYKNSINLINENVLNPHFYIFSDDPVWVKENYTKNINCSVADFNNADDGYLDLRLMSLCKHNIIANSSFSWWGAWLNNNPEKIVTAPQKWFNTKDHNTKDLIPQDWIKL